MNRLVHTPILVLLAGLSAACATSNPSAHSSGVATNQIEPALSVFVQNGAAHAHAELVNTAQQGDVVLTDGDALLCNGVRLEADVNAFPITYDADVPAATEAQPYVFELRRSSGEVADVPIDALTLALTSPTPSTEIHSAEPLDVRWTPASDDSIAILGEVESGDCSLGDLASGLSVPNSGSMVLDASNFVTTTTCTFRLSLDRNASAPVGEPFAGGTITIHTEANATLTLSP